MGCGASQPGVVVDNNAHMQRTVTHQTTHYAGSPAVQHVQTYPVAQYPQYPQNPAHRTQGPPPVYPGARQPYPTQTRGYVQQQSAVPHTTVVQQPVVVQDRGGDMIVGMAAGAMMANAMHGHHYHGYGGYHGYGHDTHIHVHDHDHFHNSEHHHEHSHYDGGGGFDGGYDGAAEGGGYDGGFDGGFDDGGGGFDDGGGFDGGFD